MMDRDTLPYKPTRRNSFGRKSTREQRQQQPQDDEHALLDYLDAKYGGVAAKKEKELQKQQPHQHQQPQGRWGGSEHEDEYYCIPLQYDSSDDDDDTSSSSCSDSLSSHGSFGSRCSLSTISTTSTGSPRSSPGRSRTRRRGRSRNNSICICPVAVSRHLSLPEPLSMPSSMPRRSRSVDAPNKRSHNSPLPTIDEFEPQKVQMSVRSLPSNRTLHNVIAQRRRQHRQEQPRRQEQQSPSPSSRCPHAKSMLVEWDKNALQSCSKKQQQQGNNRAANTRANLPRRTNSGPRKVLRSRSRDKDDDDDLDLDLVVSLSSSTALPPPPPPPKSTSRSPKGGAASSSPRSIAGSSTHSTASMMSPPKMPCRRASPIGSRKKLQLLLKQ